MTEGSNQGLFVIVAVVIFGIFVSISYLLFGDNLKPALSSIFKDGFENVNDVMGIDSSGVSSGDSSEVSYDDWVKDLESKGYVVATDSDFSVNTDGQFEYIGKSKKVIVPKIINGVTITSTKNMFKDTSVEAVAMKNPNVTDMSRMFYENHSKSLDLSNLFTENARYMNGMFSGSKATSLDLSNFDTSNVREMNYMFYESKATELKLSSFNTSTVREMGGMFYSSNATELDLSSFDISKVKGLYYTFTNSKAKTVYVRTSADADKFNNTTYKPDTLNFVVKQQ